MPAPFVPAVVQLPRGGSRFPWCGSILLLALSVAFHGPAWAAAPVPARGERGMVVSTDAASTEIGIELLRQGGTAVDAAVAVAFTLAVTYPLAGNLGGGGLMLYRDPSGAHHALDFRETAPQALTAELFQDDEGRPVPTRSLDGGLAVGVPGTVAGLAAAHRRWGSRPWPELLAPAIRLAERGFVVPPWLADAFRREAPGLLALDETRRVFAPGGSLPVEGQRLIQSDLAATLRRIAEAGPNGFYRGPVAAAIVEAIHEHDGVMTSEDLATYRAISREPLHGRYRGYRIVVFPPPSSGGVALLQILGVLEGYDLARSGYGSSRTIHLMVEAERLAFADRSRWLGDPAFVEVPVEQLIAPDYISRRARGIRPDRATPSESLQAGDPTLDGDDETMHFSVADRRGGAVAMTLTLNRLFGSGIVAPGTGVLLNNEMDDFALAPDTPNLYGLVGGEANAVAGGKRPLSSMSPTIVERAEPGGRPFLVLGSPGGSTIITSVLQVLVNVIDHDMPLEEAVNAPRFHHQWLPDRIRHEIRAFPTDVSEALVRRGHELTLSAGSIGNVNVIRSDERGGWLGAADPRRQGSAAGH